MPCLCNLQLQKYEDVEFGRCPRTLCHQQPVLPLGLDNELGVKFMKLFCPRCEDVYDPPASSACAALDGAYFGPTFAHLLLIVKPQLMPAKTAEMYIPRIFGFKASNQHGRLPLTAGDAVTGARAVAAAASGSGSGPAAAAGASVGSSAHAAAPVRHGTWTMAGSPAPAGGAGAAPTSASSTRSRGAAASGGDGSGGPANGEHQTRQRTQAGASSTSSGGGRSSAVSASSGLALHSAAASLSPTAHAMLTATGYLPQAALSSLIAIRRGVPLVVPYGALGKFAEEDDFNDDDDDEVPTSIGRKRRRSTTGGDGRERSTAQRS